MPARKTNATKKKEIFMGFQPSVSRALPPVLSKVGRSKKPAVPVFEDQKEKCLDRILLSIEEAKGRYGGLEKSTKDEAGNQEIIERMEEPAEKAYRSKMWTVRYPSSDLLTEQCEVTCRVGQSLWACFPKDDDVKDSEFRYLVDAFNLLGVLEDLHKFVSGLDKTSPEGKSFHALAIEAAKRRASRKYNPATDLCDGELTPEGVIREEKKAKKKAEEEAKREAAKAAKAATKK